MPLTSRSASVTALCLVLALGALTGCRIVPLVEPPRTAAAPTPELSRAAIIRALATYGFVVDEESVGRIRARMQKNAWTMIVDISYGKDISLRYADSVGLSYHLEHDVPYIHRGYNSRADELMVEIQRQVMLASLENKPMPSVSGSPPPTLPPAPPRSSP